MTHAETLYTDSNGVAVIERKTDKRKAGGTSAMRTPAAPNVAGIDDALLCDGEVCF